MHLFGDTVGLLFRNEKYGYEVHARSGLRFIIRHDPANLQHTVASPKTRVPQDLSTHAKESISLLIVSYDKCSSLGTWASSLSTLCATMSRGWCTLGLASLAFETAHLSGHPNMGGLAVPIILAMNT
jgi:hypothetical protein